MAAPFNVGDVVEVKSGGPNMTVQDCDGDKVVCVWFVKEEPKYGSFPVGILKKVEGGWNIA